MQPTSDRAAFASEIPAKVRTSRTIIYVQAGAAAVVTVLGVLAAAGRDEAEREAQRGDGRGLIFLLLIVAIACVVALLVYAPRLARLDATARQRSVIAEGVLLVAGLSFSIGWVAVAAPGIYVLVALMNAETKGAFETRSLV